MKPLWSYKIPLENVNDDSVVILKNHYENGDIVKNGDIVLELENSKNVVVIKSEAEGRIEYYFEEGSEVEVGGIPFTIFSNENNSVLEKLPSGKEIKEVVNQSENNSVFSDKALEYIKTNNIDLSTFDQFDLVSIDDVLRLVTKVDTKECIETKPTKKTEENNVAVFQEIDKDREELVRITPFKRREIDALKDVQSSCLNSSVSTFIELDGIFEFLDQHLVNIKHSILPLVVYECACLLKEYKNLNARYLKDNRLAYYKEVIIGIAIDMGKGLKVVSLDSKELKNLFVIDQAIADKANRYIDNILENTDLLPTTFTITDLSDHGACDFYPLINFHQSAILGVCAEDIKLHRLKLNLTFDHRCSNGKEASRFLDDLKERLGHYKISNVSGKLGSAQKCFRCFKTLAEDHNLGGRGLVQIKTFNKSDASICFNCLLGY